MMITNNETNHQNFPAKIDQVLNDLGTIKEYLKTENRDKVEVIPKTLNVNDAIALMKNKGYPISLSSIYKLTSKSAIPFKKFGRKVIFDRAELLKWCEEKTVSSNLENKVIINLAKTANKKFTTHGK